jgi:hypothetical protein
VTLPEAILMLLRSISGEGLTLAELVHELTVLRRAGREMPAVTRYAVRLSLETLEAQRQVRREGEQWFYSPVNEPVQGRLFDG